MTKNARGYSFAVGIVTLERVRFVIEGDFAPLIVETVAVQLYFLRLLFAFFGDLLGE